MARTARKDAIIAIVGATGTGKSQLAVALAQRYNGEIINGDAMQLYAGLPIITNKITVEEQQGIPHHLLGCIGLREPTWVVGTFVKKALQVIGEIRARGRLPILVGGTHYYTQSLLFHDRLADEEEEGNGGQAFVPDTGERWPILREPTEVLLEELKKVDPAMADRWHPRDRRKIQRSLEIYLQTGRMASEIYAEQRARKQRDVLEDNGAESSASAPGLRFPTLMFWAHADGDVLRQRLDQRVDRMVEQGLLDEVATLEAFRITEEANGRAVDESRGIWVSIGYKEFRLYSQALASDNAATANLIKLKADAVERTKIATRQYAKRQLRWIRIKLANALADVDADKALYLLNGPDVVSYDKDVVEPALKIAQLFLASSPMPDQSNLSETAAEMLTPRREYDLSSVPEKWARHHCEACGVTCVTEEQWVMHVRSKAHRKLTTKHRDSQEPNSIPQSQAADAPP